MTNYNFNTKNWNQEIDELENFFAGTVIPTKPIKLNDYSTITNCSIFIKSHLSIVKNNNGNPTFLPYLIRLHDLKRLFKDNAMQ